MHASAIMLLISLAEKNSSFYTNFFKSEPDRSYWTSFRLRRTISLRASESGWPMNIILLKRRLAAVSSYRGRFVAPITSTSPLLGLLMPSINTKNSVLSRLEASFSCSDRAVSIESISSMKMMLGAICSAAQNTFLIIFSDQPTSLFIMEDAEREKKVHPDSLAKALQIKVLPFPGGPQRSMPLGGALIPVQRSGRCLGRITASSRTPLTSLSPTMSLKETSSFLIMSSSIAGSSSTFFLCFSKSGFRLSLLAEYLLGNVSSAFKGRRSPFFLRELASMVWWACFGKPNLVIFILLASFSECLQAAAVFFSMYLAIFCLMASMLSLEVAWVSAYFKRRMIFSQHLMAYSSLPSDRNESALLERSLACCSFSMLSRLCQPK